jgi:DNA-binding transcriptional LysR family regulator
MNWNDVQVFLALHREGSFAGGGRVLGVNATTVSRRLTALEEAMGAQLFVRTRDGLVPTAAAEEIFPSAEMVERQMQRIEQSVGGGDARLAGRVRLNCTETMATHALIEHLGVFQRRHPDIEIELHSNDAMIDMTRGETEIAIRHRASGDSPGVHETGHIDVIARRVCSIGAALYASKAYIEAKGRPTDVDDMAGHHAILPRPDAMYLPGSNWARQVEGKVRVAIRCDSPSAMQSACSAGLGISALLCCTTLKSDNLLRLSDIVDSRDTWLLMPADLKRVARVRALWDFLVATFEQWGPLWAGEITPADRDARPVL